MNQKLESSVQFETLFSRLLNITEAMATKKNTNDVNALYIEGLQIFLQLKTLGRSFFGNEKEMTLPQPNPTYNKLSQFHAEKQFFLSQLNKTKRENKETDSYLSTVAQSSDFDLRNIDTELTIRIRLEKELLELKKNLKTLTTAKDAEAKKLDELKLKLKSFSEFSKPINDYLSLGNMLKSRQPKEDIAGPERASYLSNQLPTPLYVLYKSFHQNILTYKKQEKLSVDIIEQQPDNYFNALNISPLSVIFRIITHRKKDCNRAVLTFKFDYLHTLELVLVSTYSQRGEVNIEFNEQQFQGQKELHFLNDLVKNDNGDRLPSSSKAFLFPTLVPLVSELQGNAYNWVQALCGYSISPCPSLSFDERIKYRPLGYIADYIPDKYLPKLEAQESLKQDMKLDVDDVPVEIIEVDIVVGQGDLLMMQDTDYTERRQDKDEEEEGKGDNFQISDNEESDPKGDSNQEEENDMALDDSKLNDLLPHTKRRSDLTRDSSIVLNLVRMIKDHWWRNNS
jgi:hypothetical protein